MRQATCCLSSKQNGDFHVLLNHCLIALSRATYCKLAALRVSAETEGDHRGRGMVIFIRSHWPCTPLTYDQSLYLDPIWAICKRPRIPHFMSHPLVGAVDHLPDSDNNEMISHIIYCLDSASKTYSNIGVIF